MFPLLSRVVFFVAILALTGHIVLFSIMDPVIFSYPTFHTSKGIQVSIITAMSPLTNSHGHEAPYYACYTDTLNALLTPVSEQLRVQTQVSIFVPGRMVRGRMHDERGKDLQLEGQRILAMPAPVEPADGQRYSIRGLAKSLHKDECRWEEYRREKRKWKDMPCEDEKGEHPLVCLL